jgi:O-antigen ligase
MIVLAWERGWEKPLLGHGINSFKHLNAQVYGKNYYSHNNWMEIWYNHGLVGMVVYYSFYVIMVRKAWLMRKDSPSLSALIIASIVSIFIFEFGEVTYSANPIQMLLCLCAMVAKFGTPKKENYEQNKNVV